VARGYPDYFGQSIFPKYGGAKEVSGSKTVTANTENTIVEVSGKGVLYSGGLYAQGSDKCKDDRVRIYIDNVSIVTISFTALLTRGLVIVPNDIVTLTYYSDIEFKYHVSFLREVTFDEGFKITYEEKSGRTPTVSCGVRYALIT